VRFSRTAISTRQIIVASRAQGGRENPTRAAAENPTRAYCKPDTCCRFTAAFRLVLLVPAERSISSVERAGNQDNIRDAVHARSAFRE
jgi:hypothetical protein